MIAQHLSRWAEQWIIYMSTEFGFIKIADRYTTSSSMMPQKRNPDMLELIRGRCGNVYGDLFAHVVQYKGVLYLEDGLHRAVRAALQQRPVLHARVLVIE